MDTDTVVPTETLTPASAVASFTGLHPSQPERRVVFIYTLAHPSTGEIRYVGKTKDKLKNRLKGHLKERNQITYKASWVQSLKKEGIEPVIELLEEVEENEWEEAERFWIQSLKFLGCKLTNLTNGGDGGKNLINRPETRLKQSLAMKGRIFTLEHRRNLSEANKGKKPSEKCRLATAAIWKGKKRPSFSLITRQRMSKAFKGRKLSEAHRAKISAIQKTLVRNWFTPEYRKASSEAHKGIKNGFFGKHHSQESIDNANKSRKKKRVEKLLRLYGLRKTDLISKPEPTF